MADTNQFDGKLEKARKIQRNVTDLSEATGWYATSAIADAVVEYAGGRPSELANKDTLKAVDAARSKKMHELAKTHYNVSAAEDDKFGGLLSENAFYAAFGATDTQMTNFLKETGANLTQDLYNSEIVNPAIKALNDRFQPNIVAGFGKGDAPDLEQRLGKSFLHTDQNARQVAYTLLNTDRQYSALSKRLGG